LILGSPSFNTITPESGEMKMRTNRREFLGTSAVALAGASAARAALGKVDPKLGPRLVKAIAEMDRAKERYDLLDEHRPHRDAGYEVITRWEKETLNPTVSATCAAENAIRRIITNSGHQVAIVGGRLYAAFKTDDYEYEYVGTGMDLKFVLVFDANGRSLV
jgi:hypothetical protein